MRRKFKISKKSQSTDDTSTVNYLIKFGYGTGHIMNDIGISLALSYMLIYLMDVVELDPIEAGIILSVGQVVDGISTVVAGILMDIRTPFGLCSIYGTKKVDEVESKRINKTKPLW